MAQLPLSPHSTPSPIPSPSSRQTMFLCRVKKGSLAAKPDIGPTSRSFSIITERLLHHTEINQDDDPVPEITVSVLVANLDKSDTDSDPDRDITLRDLPPPGPLKGYEYASFQPQHESRMLSGHIRTSPTLYDANAALGELGLIIRPKRKRGEDIWTQILIYGAEST
jgi:hypothetical protein